MDAYLGHGRVAEGNRDEMLAACYQAWKTDVDAGKSSLMLAADNATVAELNRRARSERVAAGLVAEPGLALADGSVAGVGDVVVARHNDRHIRLPDGEWVRNRDRFVVTATHQDGAMTVRAMDGDGEVLLPAGYVAQHVELGYAGTVFSAQGRTVATAHALVGVGMTREALYVAATRAREANRLYVDVEPEPAGAEMAHGQAERLSAREVLVAVASRRGADLSAHQTMATEWAKAAGFDQLVREHQSLVAAATTRHRESALYGAGFSGAVLAQARQSPEWPGLLSALRDAEDRGLDVGSALAELAKLAVSPTEDTAAMLRARLRRWEKLAGGNWQPRQDLVAGLVPRASGIEDPDLAKAVAEREDAIAKRALDLAERAVRSGARWAKAFGTPSLRPAVAQAWWDRLAVVAAYRDRWRINTPSILGEAGDIGSLSQAAHRARAQRAGQEAARLAGLDQQTAAPVLGGVSTQPKAGPDL